MDILSGLLFWLNHVIFFQLQIDSGYVCTWLSVFLDTDVRHKRRLWEIKRKSYFIVFSCFSYRKRRSVVLLTHYMSDLKLKFLMNIVTVQTLLMNINTWSLCSSGSQKTNLPLPSWTGKIFQEMHEHKHAYMLKCVYDCLSVWMCVWTFMHVPIYM